MGFPFNGDLVPAVSGFANLGVNVGPNSSNAFDITSIRPFNHVHQVSGIFHDPVQGQSGVLRYSRAALAFEVSVDGGLTFNALAATPGAGTVARCYAETFGASTSWAISHGLSTLDVDVMVLDDSSPRVAMLPDGIEVTDADTVTVTFNVAQAGRVVIFGC